MSWPKDPIIHIIAGEVDENALHDEIAVLDNNYSKDHPEAYIVATGPEAGNHILPNTHGDGIWEWREVVIVPAYILEHLRISFQGVKLPDTQQAALQEVISCIPTTPTPLQEAVAKTKETAVSAPDGTTESAWLAALLTCLAETAANPGWSKPLIEMAATAARWAQLLSPGLNTLNAAATRAEKTPTYMRLADLTSLLEKIADDIDNCMGHSSIHEHLEDLTRYTLNWAAYLIEHNK